MNNEMARKYIKNSSIYIININYALKNIKSNIIADFIHIKDKNIIITTNNVASFSNLQKIEKYIKKIHYSWMLIKSLLSDSFNQNSTSRLWISPFLMNHQPCVFCLKTLRKFLKIIISLTTLSLPLNWESSKFLLNQT